MIFASIFHISCTNKTTIENPGECTSIKNIFNNVQSFTIKNSYNSRRAISDILTLKPGEIITQVSQLRH